MLLLLSLLLQLNLQLLLPLLLLLLLLLESVVERRIVTIAVRAVEAGGRRRRNPIKVSRGRRCIVSITVRAVIVRQRYGRIDAVRLGR